MSFSPSPRKAALLNRLQIAEELLDAKSRENEDLKKANLSMAMSHAAAASKKEVKLAAASKKEVKLSVAAEKRKGRERLRAHQRAASNAANKKEVRYRRDTCNVFSPRGNT